MVSSVSVGIGVICGLLSALDQFAASARLPAAGASGTCRLSAASSARTIASTCSASRVRFTPLPSQAGQRTTPRPLQVAHGWSVKESLPLPLHVAQRVFSRLVYLHCGQI